MLTNRTRQKNYSVVQHPSGLCRYKHTPTDTAWQYTTNIGYTNPYNATCYDTIVDQITSPGTFVPISVVNGVLVGDRSFKPCRHSVHSEVTTRQPAFSPSIYVASVGRTQVFEHPSGMPWVHFGTSGYYNNYWGPLSFYLKLKDSGYCTAAVRKTDAINALKLKLSDAALLNLRDVNILAFIGELKDLKQLLDLFKFNDRLDRLASDKYLGITLGALPFAGDIAKIHSLITGLGPAIKKWNDMALKGRTMNKHITIEKGSFKGVYKDSSTKTYGSTVTPTRHNYEREIYYEQEYWTKAHVYFKPRVLAADLVDDLYRNIFGLNRVLGAAWELVPYSFVVDWFVNIGDLIDAFERQSPVLQIDYVDGGYTSKCVTKIDASIWWANFSPYVEKHLVQTYNYKYSDYNRVSLVPSDLMVNGIAIGPMKFTPTISGYHASLASALIHQRLKI